MSAVSSAPSFDFGAARVNMIESQLRPNRVTDERLLSAMQTLPREKFVPAALAQLAYIDDDIAMASGRYMLEPMVIGRLLQTAAVTATDHVLDIACGTGYSSAVLSQLAKDVVALESDAVLAQTARDNLNALSIKNVSVQSGATAQGWSAAASYNVILINGAVEAVPQSLLDQLAEGGRLLCVVNLPDIGATVGEARLYHKANGVVSHSSLFNANAPLLREFAKPQAFTF